MSVTFVTAFHPVRSGLDSYLKKFEDIVATGVPILLFLDSACSLPIEYSNVRVIPSKMDTSWLPETATLPANRNPGKDTREYLALMLHKLKYMRDAAELCDTPYLAWIDFGISHVIRRPDITFQTLRELSSFSQTLTAILVPGCWGPIIPESDVWNSVHWRFCGGFFLGPRDKFASAYTRQMELVHMNLPRLTWEVNYWAMMDEYFVWYLADHDDSMILNLPRTPSVSNWTVVTGYFDLTRMPDASPSIRGRPFEHYLEHSGSTLTLNQNMVIFCEPHTVDAIKARRPEHLAFRTKYIIMNFEDFPMSKYRSVLEDARKVHPSMDDRNTVSYYLLCIARYAMLKQVIAENPFDSTHFMWLNMCIERMGMRNVRELTRVFQINRDKFSTCYIDYQPPDNYLENVMRWGKCSMCSGFFTGNAQYMKEFCDRIEDKFVSCALQGYGHADEQLFSLVYFDAPEIFEVYYGDYTEMITNYEFVKERASEPVRLIIPHSFAARDFKTCAAAVRMVWKSYELGYARLSESERKYLQVMKLLLT